jgi:iron complex outermembrane receptor protein
MNDSCKTHGMSLQPRNVPVRSLTVAIASILWSASLVAQAQEAAAPVVVLEEVVVSGIRATIQTSLEAKRESNMVVEALSVDDIGDIPALSIGEALETLTSAASHREQGGATEISIRGMGPYLGSTVINGREASNGSGDRSVNFSQFPSELFNKLAVYKTQEASMIEGGVSGQISLSTLKPLDYDKQRIQAELKGNVNPDNLDINGAKNEIGYRGTLSYVDQFEMGDDARFGLSIGAQINRSSNPEQEFRSSSAWRDCRNDPGTDSGVYSSGNCDSGSGDLVMEIDPETGVAPDEGTPFIMVPSERVYRQNITDDERDAIFLALQFQPNDRVDINLDGQYSTRTFTEIRNDLVFSEQRRVFPNPEQPDVPGLENDLVSRPDGSVTSFSNNGRIETLSSFARRDEEYTSGGLNVGFEASDRLDLNFDVSYSNTKRGEDILATRFQSEPRDIYGNATPAGTDRPWAWYTLRGGRADIPVVTVQDFDVTNPDLFADAARTRIDRNQDRENTITAARADFNLEMGSGAIVDIVGGVRYSELELISYPTTRDERTFSDEALAAANIACRNQKFPESGFLSSPANGQDLFTNVDSAGNVIESGTGNTFATFDARCVVNSLTGGDWSWPVPGQSVDNTDVKENTIAAYLQANYDTELWGKPVRGNFGLRVVNTDVDSKGLRTIFTTVSNPDGTISVVEDPNSFTTVTGGDDYTEWLPSFNMVMNLSDDLLLRGGIFRGMSRPDPADMGYGRRFNVDDDDATSIADLVGSAVATGNPDLEPLMSWNFDIALEWYPNPDTILGAGLYYKSFQGGFENIQRVETFEVDGEPVPANVTTTQTDSDTSTLWGVELSLAHSFSYLEGALSGLGVKAGLNIAESDFEFEDSTFGAAVLVDEDGNVLSQRVGLIPPADLFGFSDLVFSGQVYYGIGDWDFQLIYKYRSEYFQQFISTPGIVRYIGENSVVEARVGWSVTDSVTVTFEALNIFDEPKTQYIPVQSSISEVNSYGPRLFLGVKAKF